MHCWKLHGKYVKPHIYLTGSAVRIVLNKTATAGSLFRNILVLMSQNWYTKLETWDRKCSNHVSINLQGLRCVKRIPCFPIHSKSNDWPLPIKLTGGALMQLRTYMAPCQDWKWRYQVSGRPENSAVHENIFSCEIWKATAVIWT